MPFFGPPPRRPPWEPPEPPTWGPPIWDRPSEDTLGASVAMTVLLARSDEHALVLDEVRSYPNGFTFSLVMMGNPNTPPDPAEMHRPWMMQGRVGFEFADGSVVSSEPKPMPGGRMPFNASSSSMVVAAASIGPGGIDLDPDGVPTGHVLRAQGGGGGSHNRFSTGFWCFRLPAPGPMTIHADWPDHLDEVAVEADATPIVDASARATILWDRE